MTKFYFYRWFSGVLQKKTKTGHQSVSSCRALSFESLENREMLSVGPLLYLTHSPEPDYLQSNWFEQLEVNSGATATESIIENEWIVRVKEESLKNLYSVTKAAEYLDDYGVTVIGGLGSPGTLLVRMDTSSSELQSEILSGIKYLNSWEPNAVFSSTGVVDDPLVNLQWYLDTINVLPAWETTKGEDVVVAVIDTGAQINHPDLQANIWTNPGEIPGNGIDDDGNGFIDDVHGLETVYLDDHNNIQDRDGHGTFVAGIIGAVGNNGTGITGIAPSVKILPINAAWGGGFYPGSVILAMNYILKLKTVYQINICAINASFTHSSRSTWQTEIEAADKAGIVYVAAAGNDEADLDQPAVKNGIIAVDPPPYTFNNNNVIYVASTNSTDELSSFSNYGVKSVDLAAPGSIIESTRPSDAYTSWSGTSFAAPMVTGTVALLAALHPDWSPAQIKAAILETVDPLPSLEGKVKTGGRLNVGDAVTQSLSPPTQPPSNLSVIQQTDGTFLFKWKDNSKNETSFEFQQSKDGGITWTTTKTLNASVTTTTVSLSQVGDYEFRIYAKNQYGDSGWSNSVHVYQATPTIPQTPTGLSTSWKGYDIKISWDVAGATSYRLERSKTYGGTWTEIYSGTATEFIDSDVDSNQTYYYRVYALNDYVISNPSVQKSEIAPTRPITDKAEVTVSSIGATNVQLIWSDIKYANLYRIERFDTQKNKWVQIGETKSATFTDNSLKASTNYKYRIIAYNGFSTTSDEISITTLPPLPAAPTSVKAVAQGSNAVTLTWKVVTDILAYRVEHSLTNKTDSWETVTITPEGKITGLTPGVKHYFRVYAINSSGESAKSSSVASVTLPAVAPDEPENIVITNITDKTVTLKWDAVTNATSYKIEKYYNGKWSSAGTVKAPITEYTVKSLKALTDYQFRIIALNKTVKSETSDAISVTTPYAMTTTITKSGYALTSNNDFAFMFTGKTPINSNKTIPVTETFQYELIVSASTKTDKNTGELLDNISLGIINVTLSPDGKTYTSEPILFSKLGTIPNVNLTTLKTVQFQLKVTSPSQSQQSSAFYTKVAKLTLPKWFV
ncbi:MAG: S8 family serine peptidase [Planctomycetaceae bacterium]|jgi:subtilisin family serine protease/fibronectin type 3 domain-containing protein|nr:S8 family serine peptidase [Planctomycetaceae bacterium]